MKPQVISFHCILRNKFGKVLSTTYNHDVLTYHPKKDALLHGLTKGLEDLQPGQKREICLNAPDAYGYYDPEKIILYPRNKLQKDIAVGQMIHITGKSGTIYMYKIIQLQNDLVTLDGNHPLAGQDLVFEIEAIAARDATNEEISDLINPMSKQELH